MNALQKSAATKASGAFPVMRRVLFLLLASLLFTVPVRAAELPPALAEALPDELTGTADGNMLFNGVAWLWEAARGAAGNILRGGARSTVLLALVALICGAAESLSGGAGDMAARYVPYCGILAVAALATGDLRSLLGLGAQTVDELGALSKLLLPALAASMAAGGFVSSASVWQVTTLIACDILSGAAANLLLPLVYCFIAAAAAGAVLSESRLDAVAEGIKKLVTWGLCAAMVVFTGYLTVAGVLTGSADRTAVKVAKLAVSSAIPVVGGVLSEAAEGVLAAAGTARSTIGAAGIFAILAVCLVPLLRLGIQFLLYKLAAFVSGLVGTKELERFLDRLGEAFALVFAMTAACALVLLVALLVAVAMAVG